MSTKKFLNHIVLILAIIFGVCCISSCSDNSDEPENDNDTDQFWFQKQELINTSWKLSQSTTESTYASTGNSYYFRDKLQEHPDWRNAILTFTDEPARMGCYNLYCSCLEYPIGWQIIESDEGEVELFISTDTGYYTGAQQGPIADVLGVTGTYKISGNTLTRTHSYTDTSFSGEDLYRTSKQVFYKTTESAIGSGNNSGGSSSSQYEAPEIGFYDFTATATSVTVEFYIYNKSDCGNIKSATVYYGKNSASTSCNATVTGNLVKAKISGLSKGTSYYVKCKVSSEGGTTTSETTRVSTLY